MARSENQKLKLLYILRLLQRKSDEEHPVSMSEILAYLEENGITAERKGVYSDLSALRDFGLDIVSQRGKSGGYFIGKRDFELPELKLLVDSVQCSKFITEGKSVSLIKKLESLTSEHEARLLHRQVFVRGRIKAMNESIYYNVDKIQSAVAAKCKIRFKYFGYNSEKQRVLRHDGRVYEVSPYMLLQDDENYYLVAYDSPSGSIRHYRVDKMLDIRQTGAKRDGEDCFKEHDLAQYSKGLFGMFTGQMQGVRLRFENGLMDAVLDRFGKELFVTPDGEEHFIARAEVAVSPPFFGWLCGFGKRVKLLSPESVAQEFARYTEEIADMYR